MRNFLKQWTQRTRQLKTEVLALYLAYRDPRTPWYARVVAALVVGYALSPVDLIPDFVPVLGYVDDLLIVPLGITLALRMIPPEVRVECREKAQHLQDRPVNRPAAVVMIGIWLLLALGTARLLIDLVQ